MDNKKRFKNNDERIAYLNQKHEEIIQNQENDLVLDFDKALEEEKENTFKIKFMGKIYELPCEMPFSFSTFFTRYCIKKIKGKILFYMPEDKLNDFLIQMFGNEFLNDLNHSKDRRISAKFVFTNIVPKVMKKWGQDIDQSQIEEYQKKIMTQG